MSINLQVLGAMGHELLLRSLNAVVLLTEQMRQSNDPAYADILKKLFQSRSILCDIDGQLIIDIETGDSGNLEKVP